MTAILGGRFESLATIASAPKKASQHIVYTIYKFESEVVRAQSSLTVVGVQDPHVLILVLCGLQSDSIGVRYCIMR